MKRMISLLLVVVMLMAMVIGCAQAPDLTETERSTSGVAETNPTTTTTETDPSVPEQSKPTELAPTEPTPTEPTPTEPKPTEPKPAEPIPTEPKPTEPVPSEPEPIEREWIALQVWVPKEDQLDGGWLDTVLEKFEEMHPEYRITWDIRICSEGDAGHQVSMDPLVAADVYMFANDQLGTLISAGALTRLTGSARQQVLADYSETMVNTVTYTNGDIYGFPMTNNTWVMYYNKSIFTEDDIKSLDTMLSKGKVSFPMSNAWYSGTFFMSNGCTLFGNRGLDPSAGIQFGGQKGYTAAKKMAELAQNPNLINDEYDDFADGKVGAYFSGSWDYLGLSYELGDKLGVAQLPVVEIGGEDVQMRAFGGSKCVGVNPYSKHSKAAMELAAFMATPENQLLRFEMRGIIPASEELANDPVVMRSELAMAEINTMTYCSVVQPVIPAMGWYWAPMEQFGKDVINGEVTLSNYKERVDQLVRDLNP